MTTNQPMKPTPESVAAFQAAAVARLIGSVNRLRGTPVAFRTSTKNAVLLSAFGAVLMACGGAGEDRTYTLYRANPIDSSIRIHVATFDVDEKEAYNRENCESAGKLFQSQPGVTVKYWCEKGRFRK